MEVHLPSSNDESHTICNGQIRHSLGNRMSSFVVRYVESDVELIEILSNFMCFKRSRRPISSDR